MKTATDLRYGRDEPIAAADLAELFRASGIRRPVDDLPRLQQMLDRADLVISAWDGERLVGVCRALTDFCYCCYVSDLAVHGDWQRRGIGAALLTQLRAALDERVSVLLLSAPEAMDYYPAQGFAAADNAFLIKRLR
ncbi:GNAT family N-acetyltransferase [Denitratisoma sp. agr-D3]